MIYNVEDAYAYFNGDGGSFMDNNKTLYEFGIDREDGIKRFMGNAELYDSLLDDFVDDEDFPSAKYAFLHGNMTGFHMAVHSLKGVAGNLSLFELYAQAVVINDKLKAKNYENLDSDMDELERLYNRVRKGIQTYIN